ncbi:hypothetical protein W97_05730 [Coniosporium apollinis CBS 100218]|uniref:DUF7703 domain-containing protein n=1 Tax=Coniosporium apollinis (strain CBS 100218) TaxID=1168221 RepID=R7YWQ2_CONA1|nr:uncharacterized protein W97_05730 [Coniosporium apollinis CBS 100218]EON66337.1 hypothetical protein W97_05730 [Coniosporium apollinis CBS 100218]
MSSNTTSSSDSIHSAATGVTGGYEGNSLALKVLIAFFLGLSMYNAIEILILVFLTFSRYRGLYFWSLVISSLGLIPYGLGFLFKYFKVLTSSWKWLSLTLISIGWYPMITGQSLVLWSRLHLIVSGEKGRKILLYTKWMIIIDAIVLHIPSTVLTFGSNGDTDTAIFVRAYDIMESLQMTGFFLQEVILSSIYIVETVRILRTSFQPESRRLMHQLLIINIIIIVMDVALLGMEYASLYLLETVTKGFCYSIKLKLEFAILSRLVKFVGGAQRGGSSGDHSDRGHPITFLGIKEAPRRRDSTEDNEVSEFVDMTRVATDFTHASPLPKRNPFDSCGDDLDVDFARFRHVESANWKGGGTDGGEEGQGDVRNAG